MIRGRAYVPFERALYPRYLLRIGPLRSMNAGLPVCEAYNGCSLVEGGKVGAGEFKGDLVSAEASSSAADRTWTA